MQRHSGCRGYGERGVRVGRRWHPITGRTVPTTKNDPPKKATVPRSNLPFTYSYTSSSRALPQTHARKCSVGTALWNSVGSSLPGVGQLPLCEGLEPVSKSPLARGAWRAFPTALTEALLASRASKIKPRARQPQRPHPHRRPRSTVGAHSTGNKAAGFRPRLFTFLRYCLSQLPGGKPHCERTLNYGCSFSWRLNFWQEV